MYEYIKKEYFLSLSKEQREKIRRENIKDKIEEKKKLNKSYLKGQRGKRLYFDAHQLFEESSEQLGLEERKLKCIYTKTLRLEKLFAYLKYMNGRRVLLRDIAWHFAVTKRTIQNDLKWLESNGFITTKRNKTSKGIPHKNSYIVNTDKAKDLPCIYTYLYVVILSKQENEMYVLTKTNYKTKEQTDKYVKILNCKFSLPKVRLRVEKNINDKSLLIANNIFDDDISTCYKGYVYTSNHKEKKKFIKDVKTDIYKNCRIKTLFSLFILDEQKSAPNEYMWLKLSQAGRYIKQTHINKCLKSIENGCKG